MTSWTVRSRSGSVARSLRGAARVGVLVFVLAVSLATYVAVKVGTVYVDGRRYRDAMVEQGRLAQANDDGTIRRHLWAKADELGLPQEAKTIEIERFAGGREIRIHARYTETIALPFYPLTVTLRPEVTVDF